MGHDDGQLGFRFDATGDSVPGDGLDRWQAERRAALEQLGRRLGLPLGHRVDIRLAGGIQLRGRLMLADREGRLPRPEDPLPQLRVDRCTFGCGEIESCTRVD